MRLEPVVLVVDGELPGEPEQLGLAPKEPRGERVEGADPEPGRIPLEQPADPVLHLAGGLVGEGDGEDPLGRDAVPVDQRGDPHGEHAGLARARAGEHQHRPVDVLHRLPLRGVEGGTRSVSGVSIMRPTSASGTRIKKQAPLSVGSSTSAPPWASSTTRRERASPMPQPPRLVVNAGLEQGAADLLGNAGPVVDHPHLAHPVLGADPQDNRAAASLQRVDRVLHQRFQRPLQQHRIALHHRAHARRLQPQLDRVGPARQAGPEVVGHPVGQRPEPDRLAAGRDCRSARTAGPPARAARRRRARWSARSGGGVGRERTRSIQPWRLVSGVPIWCAASRAIATQRRSRCAAMALR